MRSKWKSLHCFLSVENPENVGFSNLDKARILSETKDVSVGQKVGNEEVYFRLNTIWCQGAVH